MRTQIFETLNSLKNFERMKEYVTYTELFLLNNIGYNFPEVWYSVNGFTLLSKSFLTKNSSSGQKHYLLKNFVLVSFYNTKDGAITVLRNQIGRYV